MFVSFFAMFVNVEDFYFTLFAMLAEALFELLDMGVI